MLNPCEMVYVSCNALEEYVFSRNVLYITVYVFLMYHCIKIMNLRGK